MISIGLESVDITWFDMLEFDMLEFDMLDFDRLKLDLLLLARIESVQRASYIYPPAKDGGMLAVWL